MLQLIGFYLVIGAIFAFAMVSALIMTTLELCGLCDVWRVMNYDERNL